MLSPAEISLAEPRIKKTQCGRRVTYSQVYTQFKHVFFVVVVVKFEG